MTVPSAEALVRRFVQLSLMLDKAVDDAAQLDEAAVKAKAAYRVAYAEAFLDADGPVEVRKHIATVKTEPQRWALDVAEQQLREVKERIFTLREQTDLAQSIGTTMRTDWKASGMLGP